MYAHGCGSAKGRALTDKRLQEESKRGALIDYRRPRRCRCVNRQVSKHLSSTGTAHCTSSATHCGDPCRACGVCVGGDVQGACEAWLKAHRDIAGVEAEARQDPCCESVDFLHLPGPVH